MRIFAIKDDTLSQEIVLGYLIYYENAKAFYIELPEDAPSAVIGAVYGCSSVLFPGTDRISARF